MSKGETATVGDDTGATDLPTAGLADAEGDGVVKGESAYRNTAIGFSGQNARNPTKGRRAHRARRIGPLLRRSRMLVFGVHMK